MSRLATSSDTRQNLIKVKYNGLVEPLLDKVPQPDKIVSLRQKLSVPDKIVKFCHFRLF